MRYQTVIENTFRSLKNARKNRALKYNWEQNKVEYFFWEVNDFCNSMCKSCDIWKRKANKDFFSPEDINDIFKTGFFSEVKEIIVSGGEPFLHKNLFECIVMMSQYVHKDCLFSVSTNGLTPEKVISFVDRMKNENVKFLIGVSLDGVGETHDIARGVKGNFDKVDFLIDQLKIKQDEYNELGKNFGITVGSTLSTQSLEWLLPVEKYTSKKGVHFLPQMYEEFSYYGEYDQNDRFGSPVESKTSTKEEYEQLDFLNENLKKDVLETLSSQEPKFQKKIMIDALNNKHLKFKCASMRKFFLLHHNGDISPCLKFAHIRNLNIKDPEFLNKWNKNSTDRCMVDNCQGCSNSWATGWSMKHWIFSFVPFLTTLSIDKILYKAKKVLN